MRVPEPNVDRERRTERAKDRAEMVGLPVFLVSTYQLLHCALAVCGWTHAHR